MTTVARDLEAASSSPCRSTLPRPGRGRTQGPGCLPGARGTPPHHARGRPGNCTCRPPRGRPPPRQLITQRGRSGELHIARRTRPAVPSARDHSAEPWLPTLVFWLLPSSRAPLLLDRGDRGARNGARGRPDGARVRPEIGRNAGPHLRGQGSCELVALARQEPRPWVITRGTRRATWSHSRRQEPRPWSPPAAPVARLGHARGTRNLQHQARADPYEIPLKPEHAVHGGTRAARSRSHAPAFQRRPGAKSPSSSTPSPGSAGSPPGQLERGAAHFRWSAHCATVRGPAAGATGLDAQGGIVSRPHSPGRKSLESSVAGRPVALRTRPWARWRARRERRPPDACDGSRRTPSSRASVHSGRALNHATRDEAGRAEIHRAAPAW